MKIDYNIYLITSKGAKKLSKRNLNPTGMGGVKNPRNFIPKKIIIITPRNDRGFIGEFLTLGFVVSLRCLLRINYHNYDNSFFYVKVIFMPLGKGH